MRNFVLFIICLLLSGLIYAQPKLNAPGNFFLKKLKEQPNQQKPDAAFIQEYDLILINGEYHIGVLGMVDLETINVSELLNLNVLNHTQIKDIWTFRVPLSSITAFCELSGLKYLEIAEPVSPYLNESVPSARIDSVHFGLGNLSQAYRGSGVVVAVIDWGFDYTHPVFYDDNLTELRLVRAWDQNKTIGDAPLDYGYGVEYIGQEALLIAQSDTDYVFGPGTHGTHVAGIAGGNGGGPDAVFTVTGNPETEFIGAAPESELIFISLKRDAPSLIDGFNYVKTYAESVNKPFVVNMSFGSHLGPHDGTDLKNIGIDNLHGAGSIFVGSAGNNGTGNFHLDRDFTQQGDTLKTVVNIHGSSDWGQTLSMWGSANSSFSASISLANSNNEVVFQTPFYTSVDQPQIDSIMNVGNGNLHIRVLSTAAFSTNNKPNIRLEVRNTTGLKIVLNAISEDTHLHIWSNARMQNRYTNWGSALGSNFPGAVAGNTDFGVGEPAGSGNNVITVGAYRAERPQPGGGFLYGAIANFSSKGPTVDGRTKPDISAGGVSVWSAVNSVNTTGAHPIDFNGGTYHFSQLSGTSMSGPLVAGIVALMLQANPQLTAVDAKEILKSTARLDQHTGDINENGTLNWGWGKANALAAVLAAEMISGTDDITIDPDFVQVFPNPATDVLNFNFLQATTGNVHIQLFDMSGKVVLQQNLNNSGTLVSISVHELPSGMYLSAISVDSKINFKRVMVIR
jgi:minor extracellular serine protease Vpr